MKTPKKVVKPSGLTNRDISKGFSAAYLLTALFGGSTRQVSIARNLWNLFGRR